MKKFSFLLSFSKKRQVLFLGIFISTISLPWIGLAETAPSSARHCPLLKGYSPVDQSFCQCFQCALRSGCYKNHFPKVLCDDTLKMKHQLTVIGERVVCRRYTPRVEPPLSLDECQAYIRYFKNYCNEPVNPSACGENF